MRVGAGAAFASFAGIRHTPTACHRALEVSFEAEVRAWLDSEGVRWRAAGTVALPAGGLLIVAREPTTRATAALHLLRSPTATTEVIPAKTTSALSDRLAARPRMRRRLVHLWEDQWREHGDIVRSRLLASLGRTRREFARRTHVRRIDAATLDAFLVDNHLWGPTKARYRYGLYRGVGVGSSNGGATSGGRGGGGSGKAGGQAGGQGELVAVASFSPRRHMTRDGFRSRSHELIRYCSRRGETVVGGISKLIAAFTAEAQPDDIVTVIDRDWSTSDAWRGLGFRSVGRMDPVAFFVGPDGLRRHPGEGPNPHRRRLPPDVLGEFEREWGELRGSERRGSATGVGDEGWPPGSAVGEAAQRISPADRPVDAQVDCERRAALCRFLAARGYFAVHDAGAERLRLEVAHPALEEEEVTRTRPPPVGAGAPP